MTELVSRASEDSRTAFINEVYAALPIAGCEARRNELTGAIEYEAPEGKAFKVVGDFEILNECSDPGVMQPPVYSAGRLKRLFPQQYAKLMEDTGGNERLVLSVLEEDEDGYFGYSDYDSYRLRDIPAEFIGRWLFVDITQHAGKYKARIGIRDEAESWSEDAFFDLELPGSNNSPIPQHHLAEVPLALTYWLYYYASFTHDEAAVEIVDHTQPRQDGHIDIPKSRLSDTLWWPHEHRPSSTSMADYYAEMSGKTLGDAERTRAAQNMIDHGREIGRPMQDDPLRELQIVYGKDAENLNRLVSQILGKEVGIIIPKRKSGRQVPRIILPDEEV